MPVDNTGTVRVEELEKVIDDETCLVSIMLANNEIGTIQPIKELAAIAHAHGALFHTDAVQAIGQIPINVKELGIDLLTCSGHKLGAPKGVGFLYKKSGVKIEPLIYGSQMDFMRGGTENVPYIIGLSKAIDCCDISQKTVDKMYSKRKYLINLLESRFDCELNGDSYYRLPNSISITFSQNITGEALLYTLDISNINVSTGSACNSREISPSHVLKAIGLSDEQAMRTIRITLSDDTTYDEIDYVVNEIGKAIKLIEI